MSSVSIKKLSPALAANVMNVYNFLNERDKRELAIYSSNNIKKQLDEDYAKKYKIDTYKNKIDYDSPRYKEFAKNYIFKPYTEQVYKVGENKYVTIDANGLVITERRNVRGMGGMQYGPAEIEINVLPTHIWMVCDVEVYAKNESEILSKAKKAVGECNSFLYALNPDRAIFNNEHVYRGDNEWSYQTKIKGKDVLMHMEKIPDTYDEFYVMWREEMHKGKPDYFIRVVKLVSYVEIENSNLYKDMVKTEIALLMEKEKNSTIKKLLEFVKPTHEFIEAIQEEELPFTLSESFNNLLGQVEDNNQKMLIWDDVIEEVGDSGVNKIIVK